jgi:hypothetical protein
MSKELSKKEILGGKQELPVLDPTYQEPDYSPEATKKELAEKHLPPNLIVKYTDPITGENKSLDISRTGHNEAVLIETLADPKLTRDRKDYALSMYLFERGKDNASMLVELFRYKGQHTKETRAFASQMRFDFEMFLSMFTSHMKAVAQDVATTIGIWNIKDFCDKYLEAVSKSVHVLHVEDFATRQYGVKVSSMSKKALLQIAVRNWTEAEAFEAKSQAVTTAREAARGKGIYIDAQGRPYSIYEDLEVDQVVKKDMERIKKEETHE